MPLQDMVGQIVHRFNPSHRAVPANGFTIGLVVDKHAQVSITFDREAVQCVAGVRDAEFIVYGSVAQFADLLNPTAQGRAALVEQLRMRPDYPFKNYLLSIFLDAFNLTIPDLDYSVKPFDGPFPFPPRYPVAANDFRLKKYQPTPLPVYNPALIPELVADRHPEWVAMYDRAWQLAFQHLRQPAPASNFIANFIDLPFNGNTFMWDSCFMTLFGGYGRRLFNFLGTLDNFYAKQHDDGFICREISTQSGRDLFQSLDPRSTGPNILAWAEWASFQWEADLERLQQVFPVLMGYHRWWKEWRTHPDGSYWTSGWGSGMDNQTRVPYSEYHHRQYTWLDANMQQALNCRVLRAIENQLGDAEFSAELDGEFDHLSTYINTHMWDETAGFYYDLAPDGTLSRTKSIGAYWGLLSEVVPAERAARMIAHLEDPAVFNRPHRIPTQSYDSPVYNPHGNYWLGSVWSPTNYMVLQGLTRRGYFALAHEIALNHVTQVANIFSTTGTLWENYAPEYETPGTPAGRDFVGWTGLSAINIPIEYLIGLRPLGQGLVWQIRLLERHGIWRYPLGPSNSVDLICESRNTETETAYIRVSTQQPLILEVVCANRHQTLELTAGTHRLQI